MGKLEREAEITGMGLIQATRPRVLLADITGISLRVLSSLKNPKIREKLGSRCVGQAPTRIFGGKFVFFVGFFVVLVFPNVKKKK